MLLGPSGGIDFWCDPTAQDHFFSFLVEIYCDIVTIWQMRQISPNDVIVGKKRFPFEFKNIILRAGEQGANAALRGWRTHIIFLSGASSLEAI